MKKIIGSIFLFCGIFAGKSYGQIYMADSAKVSFFSETKAENIDAKNTICKPIMSIATGEFDVSLVNTSFEFPKSLMKEHFNEDYMESSKFPKTIFTGKISGNVDYLEDGTYNVSVTGTMDMHGVKKQITVPGTITVKGGVLFIYAKFNVKIADYNIKLPSFLSMNVADNVDVTVTATMKPYKK
ncbi:MAG TPA: YceI family protein [Bacteroidia bacterium]|jgi:polyisoprenoid-binding protein YceI|nr:YceI family protein [Bacteroidia bacterium]